MWGDIVKLLGSAVIIVGAAAWVAKKAIDTWLSHRLDTHKSDLDHALDIAKLCPARFGGVEVRPIMDLSGG